MNNEKILNIMENLSKAVYDIAATTKHIYKDEHPTGPTMPMPASVWPSNAYHAKDASLVVKPD